MKKLMFFLIVSGTVLLALDSCKKSKVDLTALTGTYYRSTISQHWYYGPYSGDTSYAVSDTFDIEVDQNNIVKLTERNSTFNELFNCLPVVNDRIGCSTPGYQTGGDYSILRIKAPYDTIWHISSSYTLAGSSSASWCAVRVNI